MLRLALPLDEADEWEEGSVLAELR